MVHVRLDDPNYGYHEADKSGSGGQKINSTLFLDNKPMLVTPVLINIRPQHVDKSCNKVHVNYFIPIVVQ